MTEQRPTDEVSRDGTLPEQLSLLDPADQRLIDDGPEDFGEWLRWLREQNLRTGRPA